MEPVMNPVCEPGSLADRLRFVRAFLCDPQNVGAIAPASSSLGDRIGAATRKAVRDGLRNGASAPSAIQARPRIVRAGRGTGSVSRFISAMNPVLIERNGEWAAILSDASRTSRFGPSARRLLSPTSTILSGRLVDSDAEQPASRLRSGIC
jgi:hypothetical protein